MVGHRVGALRFAATVGGTVDLGASSGCGVSIVFVYPLTGRPGVDLPDGFAEIPGARGCTEQACGFRDHHRELLDAGAARVVGLSAQSTGYQRELVHRLHLPYPLLADPRLTAAHVLGLPTFTTGRMTLYRPSAASSSAVEVGCCLADTSANSTTVPTVSTRVSGAVTASTRALTT